jgi:hypothetical protein
MSEILHTPLLFTALERHIAVVGTDAGACVLSADRSPVPGCSAGPPTRRPGNHEATCAAGSRVVGDA